MPYAYERYRIFYAGPLNCKAGTLSLRRETSELKFKLVRGEKEISALK